MSHLEKQVGLIHVYFDCGGDPKHPEAQGQHSGSTLKGNLGQTHSLCAVNQQC